VTALGVVASNEAIDALFDELDDDGGGSLDPGELKTGLKTLLDAAKSNEQSTATLEKQARAMGARVAAHVPPKPP
jgi:Ca2+-binding EF-hand superfamily protein